MFQIYYQGNIESALPGQVPVNILNVRYTLFSLAGIEKGNQCIDKLARTPSIGGKHFKLSIVSVSKMLSNSS